MADDPTMPQSPLIIEQPLGHAVDREVGVGRVAVGRGLAVVEEMLVKPGLNFEDVIDGFDLPLGCTGLSSSTYIGGSSTGV